MSGRRLFSDWGEKKIKEPGHWETRIKFGVCLEIYSEGVIVSTSSLGSFCPIKGGLYFSSTWPHWREPEATSKLWEKSQVADRESSCWVPVKAEPDYAALPPSCSTSIYPAPPWQNHETSLLCTRKGKWKKKEKTRGIWGMNFFGVLFLSEVHIKILSFIH